MPQKNASGRKLDKITLKNMAFYAFHGVNTAEVSQGQRFFIDVEIYLDLKEAGVRDDMNLTANYADVFKKVKEIAENRRFILIEALAEAIASAILKNFGKVQSVVVRVRKPSAPIVGILDYTEVEIHRTR